MNTRACLSALGILLSSSLFGCYKGTTQEPKVEVGSESHFLERCKRDAECGDLRCMENVCTKACTTDDMCSALSSASICQHDPSQSGGSCDVECGKDIDCQDLGGNHRCSDDQCRSGALMQAQPEDAGSASEVDRDAAQAAIDAGSVQSGGNPTSDAAISAGEGCIPNPNSEICPEICPEICDDIDNDCDRRIDEDTASDDCVLQNALPICNRGECIVVECNAGYADCNANAADGCETTLNTLSNCGGCGNVCVKLTCVTGTCTD